MPVFLRGPKNVIKNSIDRHTISKILHACFHETDPKEILKRTYDSLDKGQFEIDMVEVIGTAFKNVDNRKYSNAIRIIPKLYFFR